VHPSVCPFQGINAKLHGAGRQSGPRSFAMTRHCVKGGTPTRYAPDSGHLRGSIMRLTRALRAPAGRSRQAEVSLERVREAVRYYGSC
jgi:hypothetical protein